ncbi:MAG: CRISPR system precrRNA processing endoribonuclease RAMP protein Cas6 [Methanotrichaceae archaeon]|nr:CRISPR system precrRNA processing endoribonuclease RAMP protein Cas6 [Methanotrichaceae archaeon]
MPQKITMITRPLAGFEVPSSEGPQLYSAILRVIREGSEAAAARLHDLPPSPSLNSPMNSCLNSLSLCPLQGRFKRSLYPRRKELDPKERYGLVVGITDQRDAEIFRSVIQPLVSREKNLRLKRGELRVEELASNCASFEELLASADNLRDPCIEFEFKSPTCIVYRNSKAFEMFPHREAVFFSLLSKWNSVCPEELKMDIERDEMRRFIVEKPLVYEMQSAVISTVFDRAKGQARPIIRQGFVGSCRYTFTRDAPEKVQKGIVALARFAEYSGVGSSVGHGCGAVAVKVRSGLSRP